MQRTDLLSCLRRFGSHSLAYSTVQPLMNWYGIDDIGYVAFRRLGHYTFVLGDPVADPARVVELLDRFHGEHDRPCYVHIGQVTSKLLAERGYRCNSMGVESWINLHAFNPTWGSHNALRESERRFAKLDIRVVEASLDRLGQFGITREDITAVSDRWLSARPQGRELRFLVRPLVVTEEPGVRRFFLLHNDRLVGYVCYDPVYRDNRIEGYCPNIARFDDRDLPTGRSVLVNLEAARRFARENIPYLALGLSPLAGDLRSPFADRVWLRGLFRLGRRLSLGFEFDGLTRHKSYWKGETTPVYYASGRRGPDALLELRALARLVNLY
ncbi:DUF2156 domain-containing protein [candidate division GN15 bacterium]|nr:DUF2156 domain-containing protein [candidate division GN15 bacterium]